MVENQQDNQYDLELSGGARFHNRCKSTSLFCAIHSVTRYHGTQNQPER
jgi:hypothetical protein